MKVAFHFNADHPEFSNTIYRFGVEKLLFNVLLCRRNLSVYSKVLIGDLLIYNMADIIKVRSDGSQTLAFNPDNFFKIIELWLRPENNVWSGMIDQRLNDVLGKSSIFVICFETIEFRLAKYINEKLQEESEAYLGALEVDDTSFIHWRLYTGSLILEYRIINNNASIFWDGSIRDDSINKNTSIFWDDSSWDDLIENSMDEDEKDETLVEHLKEIGFRNIDFESRNGKYTLVDKHDGYEQAKKIAEWNKRCGNLLAFIADDVVCKLRDVAPDLGDDLWAVLDTFDRAETPLQFANVAHSCRMIIEYISDKLYPPKEKTVRVNGRKVGESQYINRILAYLDEATEKDTNNELISVKKVAFRLQMQKLHELANKGAHEKLCRSESRRCLLRTIILLDDIALFKTGTFIESSIKRFKEIEFKDVNLESLSEYHDIEQAQRVAEWKERGGKLLASIADHVVHHLIDAVPDLGNKLWFILDAFCKAETIEQFAQVTASCKQIVEDISNQLYPPMNKEVKEAREVEEAKKLEYEEYRSRLLVFADEARKSDTNIDLICVSKIAFVEHIDTLSKLTTEGIHADVYREETRRCLLRTIILLDDIISLKIGAFEIKTELNLDEIIKNLEGEIGEIIKRNPNIDRILVTTKALNQQRENLTELLNKGTHAEINKLEARCLLKTISSLLDDIASLNGAFEIKGKLNPDFLSQINQLKQLVDNQMFDSLEE